LIRHFLNPPNWFTSASIFCGTYALGTLIAAEDITPQLMVRACILVLFGGVFDLLDGRVARMTNRFSEFGVQLDSLADLISFGVAPAMLAWAWKLHELGGFGAAVAFWYILCAAFRLARFNVNANHGSWKLGGHTQGLTSTMAGACLVVFVWLGNGYLLDKLAISPFALAFLVAWLGLMMVSSIPFRSFKDMRRNPRARALFAFAFASCLTGAVVLDPSMWFGVGAALYVTLGLVDGLITAAWFRRRGAVLDAVGEPMPQAAVAALLEDEIAEDAEEEEEEELEEVTT
jgi:CDP-diacylglycerol--serine O-phosphatidyltransferase